MYVPNFKLNLPFGIKNVWDCYKVLRKQDKSSVKRQISGSKRLKTANGDCCTQNPRLSQLGRMHLTFKLEHPIHCPKEEGETDAYKIL